MVLATAGRPMVVLRRTRMRHERARGGMTGSMRRARDIRPHEIEVQHQECDE
jgi:hypothetical protein